MRSVIEGNDTDNIQLDKKENLSHPAVIAEKSEVDGPYAKYVLFVLFLVYILNFVDRQLLLLMVVQKRGFLHAAFQYENFPSFPTSKSSFFR